MSASGPAQTKRDEIRERIRSLLREGDLTGFLRAYRRERGFLGLDEGRELDEFILLLEAKPEQITDFQARKELALILFGQNRPGSPEMIWELWRQRREDPDLALAMVLHMIYSRDELPGLDLHLEPMREVLPPGQWEELLACQHGQPSPVLLERLDKLLCLHCGRPGLDHEPDAGLRCQGCGHLYTMEQGVPLLLKEEYDQYLHLEPQYQATYPDYNVLWTDEDLRFSPLHAGQLYNGRQRGYFTAKELLNLKYNRLPQWYALRDFFLEFAPGHAPGLILDIGAGRGADALALSRLYPQHHFFALDVVKAGCVNAHRFRGHQPMQFMVADASSKLPFADAVFDLVYSVMAIEHCRAAMMEEVWRVLKPGGRAFIAGPSIKSYIFNEPLDNNLKVYLQCVEQGVEPGGHGLSKQEFASFFQGFEVTSHTSNGFFPRCFLESDLVDQLSPRAMEAWFREFCGVMGAALDRNDDSRWYNYIQMFALRKLGA